MVVDSANYMSEDPPASIGNTVYGERMERGKEVIQAIAEEQAFVGCEGDAYVVAKRVRSQRAGKARK